MKMKRLFIILLTTVLFLCPLVTGSASILSKEERYSAALDKLESYLKDETETDVDLSSVSNNFDELDNYQYSYQLHLYTAILQAIKEGRYEDALSLLNSSIKDNTDFQQYLNEQKSLKSLEEIKQYVLACQAEQNGDLHNARIHYQKSGILDSWKRFDDLRIPAMQQLYTKACSYMEEPDGLQTACEAFKMLHESYGYYEDSLDKLTALEAALAKAEPTATPAPPPVQTKQYTVGDTILFGRYEQDDVTKEPEPIEWIILDIEDNRALLLSKYVLEQRSYHTARVKVVWGDCELRIWLNGSFYNGAFTEEEKKIIELTKVIPIDSYKKDNSHKAMGEATDDYLFILNRAEVEKYLPNAADRQTTATRHAFNNNVSTDGNDPNKPCNWTLRQPYTQTTSTPSINFQGQFDAVSVHPNPPSRTGIRPALWIKLDP